MRFAFEQHAGPDSRFGECAFDSQIGKTIRVEVAPGQHEQGVLLFAEVIDGGKRARIEVEVSDDGQAAALLKVPLDGLSIGGTVEAAEGFPLPLDRRPFTEHAVPTASRMLYSFATETPIPVGGYAEVAGPIDDVPPDGAEHD